MNSKNIILFEYQKISYSSIGIMPDHRMLRSIERLNTANGIEYFEVHGNYLKATNYVGIFMFEDWSIQVLPKIDFAGNSDSEFNSINRANAARSAAENLIRMLSYVYKLQVSGRGLRDQSFESSNWFELLIFMFGTALRELMKKGIYREYILVDEQASFLRGKWLVARQLLEQPHLKHKFLVAFDEYSPDNTINRILKYCAYQMNIQARRWKTKSVLQDILAWQSDVMLLSGISTVPASDTLFSRINREYEPLYNLAAMFIANRVFTMSSGRVDAFALMFDMNRLFEEFVYAFIVRFRRQILPENWRAFSIRFQSEGQHLYLASRVSDGKQLFRLQPDLLFATSGAKAVLVADTKYKRISPSSNNRGVSQTDVYQMLAYATRFGSKKALLIYPQDRGSVPTQQNLEFQTQDIALRIGTVNICQPLRDPAALITEFSRLFATMLAHEGDQDG